MYFRQFFLMFALLFLAFLGCGTSDDPPIDDDDDNSQPTATEPPVGSDDQDGDGFDADVDCNDQNASINPGATELCDGLDNNCNSQADEGFAVNTYYPDADGDSFGDASQPQSGCAKPEGYVSMGGDCDDTDPAIKPIAVDITCNGIDENCNGLSDDHPNADGDTYDICDVGVAGADNNPRDCNDSNSKIYPTALELCDNLDNDCDDAVDEDLELLTFYRDSDSDSYGNENDTTDACGAPQGYVENNEDCDDKDSAIFPGAPETGADGIDSNCNGYSDWITTVSGTGAAGYAGDSGPLGNASFRSPGGFAEDRNGNLYIADTANHVIRKIDVYGIVTTVVGTGQAGYQDGYGTTSPLNSPTAVASDGLNIYIADTGNNRIRKYSVRDDLVNTVAGKGDAGYTGDGGFAKDATLNQPMGVEISLSQTLYVADTGNHAIRSIGPMGNPSASPLIDTVAGNGTAGYAGDGGTATESMLSSPSALALDTSGSTLYIADTGNHVLRKLDRGTITRVAGTPQLEGFDGDRGQANYALLSGPTALVLDVAKNIYFSDAGNGRIRQVTPNGIIYTVAGSGSEGDDIVEDAATNVDLMAPMGLILDAEGNLWISDTGHSWIRTLLW